METTTGQDVGSLFAVVSLIMVIVCIAAFVTIRWVFPKMIRSPFDRKDGPLRVLARYALEPRKAIYVLRIGKKYVVIGASERDLSFLTDLKENELADEWVKGVS